MEQAEGHPGTTLLNHLLHDQVVQSSPAYEQVLRVLREAKQLRDGSPEEVEVWFLAALRHRAIRTTLTSEKRALLEWCAQAEIGDALDVLANELERFQKRLDAALASSNDEFFLTLGGGVTSLEASLHTGVVAATMERGGFHEEALKQYRRGLDMLAKALRVDLGALAVPPEPERPPEEEARVLAFRLRSEPKKPPES
jgi:hypothetical protein